MAYPQAAWERAITVQEVMLKALSGELHWFRAAEILRWSPRTLRRTAEHSNEMVRRRLDGPIDRVGRAQRRIGRVMSSATALVALIALLISIAGTCSVMSFTVARHPREIGIRIALGADRRRIIAGVFSRAIAQIGIGVVVGAFLWFYLFVYRLGGDRHFGLFVASAGILALVGTAACGLPVRRAVRIESTEALRQFG